MTVTDSGRTEFLPLSPELLAELRRIELRSRRSLDADLMGRYRSAFRGTGLTFSDLREYQPGDDTRHIHWKVTARTNKPFVKTYEEDRHLNIVLAVDISRSMDFGNPKTKYRKAVEFSALIATLAHRNHDNLALCLFAGDVTDFVPLRGSRTQLQQVLYTLLQQRTLPQETNISNALTHLRTHIRRTSIIFLLSDFIGEQDYQQELRTLSFKHDLIAVSVEDSGADTLPSGGLIEFLDAESGERFTLDTSSKKVREALRVAEQQREQQLGETMRQCGADLLFLRSELLTPLSTLMRRRAKRLQH